MKTLGAVAILAMVIVPPALAKVATKWALSAPQQGYQSSERPGYYPRLPSLSDWYRDALSSY